MFGTLKDILAEDPRPAYEGDEKRVYGFGFAGCEIKFKVARGVLRVTDIIKKTPENEE